MVMVCGTKAFSKTMGLVFLSIDNGTFRRD